MESLEVEEGLVSDVFLVDVENQCVKVWVAIFMEFLCDDDVGCCSGSCEVVAELLRSGGTLWVSEENRFGVDAEGRHKTGYNITPVYGA